MADPQAQIFLDLWLSYYIFQFSGSFSSNQILIAS